MDHILLVVAAVGSAFTAVVTAVYAYFTYRILQANRDVVLLTERQLLAANRPFVTIRAATRPASQIFQLSIASTGNTAAKNLRLSISPDFHRFAEGGEDNSLQALHMFRENIDSFPPKMELNLDLGVSWQLYENDTQSISPLVFTVCAEYDGQAEHYAERTVIDLRVFGKSSIGTYGPTYELQQVSKQIERLVDSVNAARTAL